MRLLSTVVTKASQVKAGDLFRIVGNNSAGFPIPEQLFLVKTPVLRMSVMGLPYVMGETWFSFGKEGQMRHEANQKLFLDAVGVYETGSSQITDYSKMAKIRNPLDGDVHLERVTKEELAASVRSVAREARGYQDIMAQNANGKVIGA